MEAQERHHYESLLRSTSPAYLTDHRIFEQVLFPSTGFLELMLAAGEQVGIPGDAILSSGTLSNGVSQGSVLCVESVQIERGLLLTGNDWTTLQTVVQPDGDGYEIEVYSRLSVASQGANEEARDGSAWVRHTQAQVRVEESVLPNPLDIAQYKAACPTEVPVATHYDQCAERGLNYGPCFQGIHQLWKGKQQAVAIFSFPRTWLPALIYRTTYSIQRCWMPPSKF